MSENRRQEVGILRYLCLIHDTVSKIGGYFGIACLVLMVAAYCIEIVSRYLLDSPTQWSNSAVAYALCVMLFTMTPILVKDRAQIFIGLLPDSMNLETATRYMKVIYAFSSLACLFTGWFCYDVAVHQFTNNIQTVNEWSISKWWLSALLPYGFFSSGIYFLRHAFNSDLYSTESEIVIS